MKKLQPIYLALAFGFLTANTLTQSTNTLAPNFSGSTKNAKTIQLSDFRNCVILLDFWASWCGPCKKEMPFLIEMQKKYQQQGLQILAINLDTKAENVESFLSGLKEYPTFPVLLDPDAKIPPLYKLEGMPTTFLIDRQGNLRYKHTGFKPEQTDQFEKEILILLNEKQEP